MNAELWQWEECRTRGGRAIRAIFGRRPGTREDDGRPGRSALLKAVSTRRFAAAVHISVNGAALNLAWRRRNPRLSGYIRVNPASKNKIDERREALCLAGAEPGKSSRWRPVHPLGKTKKTNFNYPKRRKGKGRGVRDLAARADGAGVGFSVSSFSLSGRQGFRYSKHVV